MNVGAQCGEPFDSQPVNGLRPGSLCSLPTNCVLPAVRQAARKYLRSDRLKGTYCALFPGQFCDLSFDAHLYTFRTGERSNHAPARITPSTPMSIVGRSPIIPPSMPASSAPTGAMPCDKNYILAFVRPRMVVGTIDCRRLTSAMR